MDIVHHHTRRASGGDRLWTRSRRALAIRVGAVAIGVVGIGADARCAAVTTADRRAGDRTDVQTPSGAPASPAPDVPTPASIIGHDIGDGAVRYVPLVRYLYALADASPFVVLTPYAESHEGRTLYYLTITSEANHARLDAIRHDNEKLFDPRKLTAQDDPDRIIDALPGIAWLAYSIHGDELSSTDAAVQVAYLLAAGTDDTTKRLRHDLVIHIDPLQNPDGRERYLAQLQHLTGNVPNPDFQAMQHSGLWSAGRGNHYLFDLNRDWLMQVHPETRGRAAVVAAWHPHLVVDSHEMGSLDTYLFDPPREPFNLQLSEQTLAWRRRFSADQAAAFDRHGWSYYTREWYEEWYPGYTNAWANLRGAVGLLYEQAGVNAALIRRAGGDVLTYRDAVRHHVVSSLANLETLRANKRDLLHDVLADRRRAVSDAGTFTGTLIVPSPPDRARFVRLLELLRRQGIETTISAEPFDAADVVDVWGERSDAKTFPAGTLVVPSTQPERRLLHALLGFDPHMSDAFLLEERRELERHRGGRIYDVTAWNLPMAYGLEAYWAGGVAHVSPGGRVQPTRTEPASLTEPPQYGYVIDGAGGDIHRALVRLFDHACKPRVASKPFTIGGRRFERGTVLLRRHENPETLASVLRDIVTDMAVDIRGVDTALSQDGPDLGGRRFHLLQPPRVAIASQWPLATTSFGSTWFLLDARLGLRTSPVNVQRIGSIDLRKYNVLILPHAWNTGSLAAVLGDAAVRRIKAWVESGGTLIAIGGAAAFAAGKDRGLSSVRLRRDVLDKLDVYNDALRQERAARRVVIRPDEIWGTTPQTRAPAHADARQAGDKAGVDAAVKTGTSVVGETGADAGVSGGADTGASAWRDVGAKPRPTNTAATTPPEVADAHAAGNGRPNSGSGNSNKDADARRRRDEWQRMFSPDGTMLAAELDPEHWLAFGAGAKLPVLVSGGYVYMSKYPVATPVRLVEARRLRLSGLLWPEARKRHADSAYATVERVGRGQIILFASDPFFRGYFEGTGRLLLNAVLLGPGMGTSAAVPW